MKREIDRDPMAGKAVPEKSRLGGFASWLLQ
jgi:hypothetical protein